MRVEHAFQCGCSDGRALRRGRQMKMERLNSILSKEIHGNGLDFQTLLILVMLCFSVQPN